MDEKKWFGRHMYPYTWQGWLILILQLSGWYLVLDWASKSNNVAILVVGALTPIVTVFSIFFLFRKHF